jgi:hypothetical protein
MAFCNKFGGKNLQQRREGNVQIVWAGKPQSTEAHAKHSLCYVFPPDEILRILSIHCAIAQVNNDKAVTADEANRNY